MHILSVLVGLNQACSFGSYCSESCMSFGEIPKVLLSSRFRVTTGIILLGRDSVR